MMFTADWFNSLDRTLREMGLDSDAQSFDEIKEMLSVKRKFTPDEFADMCAYVVYTERHKDKKKNFSAVSEKLKAKMPASKSPNMFEMMMAQKQND